MRLILLIILLLASCSVMPVRDYGPNYKTRQMLEDKRIKFENPVVSSDMKDANNKIMSCRAMNFNFLKDMTYVDFFQNAMITEIENARSKAVSGNKIEVKIVNLELNSNTAYWKISSITKWNDKKVHVDTQFDFPFVFMGNEACNTAANTLADATSEHINAIFKALLR